jgi:hypothetical protein
MVLKDIVVLRVVLVNKDELDIVVHKVKLVRMEVKVIRVI